MPVHFELVDLRLLGSIAEANSLTHGAERAHLSLLAVSKRIKHLEQSLGTALFYRTSQGVTLTPPGQAFVHHARLVLSQLEHLYSDLREYVQGVKGHVRVLANTTAITEFLPPILRTYLVTHPDVSVDLKERLSVEIVRAISDGTADIGIVAGNVRTEDLQVLSYWQDRLVLATAHEHPLAQKKSIRFSETLEFDYIGLYEASALHSFLKQAADNLKKSLKLRIQMTNVEAVCRMVEANVGISVLPESAARRHAKSLAIQLIHLTDKWAVRNLRICVRDLKQLPVFARELIDLLIADTRPDADPSDADPSAGFQAEAATPAAALSARVKEPYKSTMTASIPAVQASSKSSGWLPGTNS
jgi:DNA-binding transcriptional LysR family regulator